MDTERGLGRRRFLKKTVVAGGIVGITGLGTAGKATASSLDSSLALNGAGEESARSYYEVHVSGNINRGGSNESNDNDHGDWVSGYLRGGDDYYDYSGVIEHIYVGGDNTISFYMNNGLGYSGDRVMSVFTENGAQTVNVGFSLTGCAYEHQNTLEFSDETGCSFVNCYVEGGIDKYNISGQFTQINVNHPESEQVHIKAPR